MVHLTLREKARIRKARGTAAPPPTDEASIERLGVVLDSMRMDETEHADKRRDANRRSQERFRQKAQGSIASRGYTSAAVKSRRALQGPTLVILVHQMRR
jgi:hypothetical protein